MIPFIILYIIIVDVKKLYNLSYTPLLMSLLLTILILNLSYKRNHYYSLIFIVNNRIHYYHPYPNSY